ncbi:MAG TPA: L-seryl-tRNA(Sec) selenium transferase [Polyangiales bacterium]|jgi:L-seryl-tRNA(Ser) seleniumtransferase|nr:L-seryl-tRNA(Sec) selenium transferase [Polyangiales bacterium]
MRELPAMHRVLAEPVVAEYEATLGRETVKCAVEREFDRVRISGVVPVMDELVAAIGVALDVERLQGLIPVINATGVLVHTNLGRAPLASEALAAVERLGHGYTNLEYDLAAGERGSRYARATSLLCELSGAQDALVVNNCAAAVLLVLDTFAKGREVIVARNQLVEIGGGFRIPDVLERSGAYLREVGATNKVYVADFERALCPQTALLLRVHPSNYSIEGFTHDVPARELAELGARVGVPVVEDLGSGALIDLQEYGLPHERTVAEALNDGVGLVAFSGDKLLGGPQAGVLLGRANLIARLRDNPLVRALRVDKMTLAALGATLQLHRTPESRARIPLYRMLGTTIDELRARAAPYLAAMPGATLVESDAYAGGGALPRARIASLAISLAVENPTAFAAALRRENPAIVARIERDRVLFDLRTIAPEEDDVVISTVTSGAPEIDVSS